MIVSYERLNYKILPYVVGKNNVKSYVRTCINCMKYTKRFFKVPKRVSKCKIKFRGRRLLNGCRSILSYKLLFQDVSKVVYFNLNRDLHMILIVCNLDVYATIAIYFI